MSWMKTNSGKTLIEAIKAYIEIKQDNSKPVIAPQFEYNTFIRDFLRGNPHLKTKDAIKCWNIKRNLPGSKKYSNTDLNLM